MDYSDVKRSLEDKSRFDPKSLEKEAEKLMKEGRFPSDDVLASALEAARAVYREKLNEN